MLGIIYGYIGSMRKHSTHMNKLKEYTPLIMTIIVLVFTIAILKLGYLG